MRVEGIGKGQAFLQVDMLLLCGKVQDNNAGETDNTGVKFHNSSKRL